METQELLTAAEFGERIGVERKTITNYRLVAEKRGYPEGPGDFPAPTRYDRNGHPMWSPAVVEEFATNRKGRGWWKGDREGREVYRGGRKPAPEAQRPSDAIIRKMRRRYNAGHVTPTQLADELEISLALVLELLQP